jgi:thiol-disulfide isomerase/thioredoxin
MSGSDMLVVCLCAEWCGVCRDYLERFDKLRARFPQVRFAWVDVEDQSDLVDPLEVDDFPTLLIARGGEPVFFGPVRPQAEALERLLRDRMAGDGIQIAALPGEVAQLVLRLRAATL